jgi:hypothetical protein
VIDLESGSVLHYLDLPYEVRPPTATSLSPSGSLVAAKAWPKVGGHESLRIWRLDPTAEDPVVYEAVIDAVAYHPPNYRPRFFWGDDRGVVAGVYHAPGGRGGPPPDHHTVLLPILADGTVQSSPKILWDGDLGAAVVVDGDLVMAGESEDRPLIRRVGFDGTTKWNHLWPPPPFRREDEKYLVRPFPVPVDLVVLDDLVCGSWYASASLGCVSASDGSEVWTKRVEAELGLNRDRGLTHGIAVVNGELLVPLFGPGGPPEIAHYSADGLLRTVVEIIVEPGVTPPGEICGLGRDASVYFRNRVPRDEVVRFVPTVPE